jgi:hypothetical protein
VVRRFYCAMSDETKPPPKIYTMKEAATALRISRRSLQDLIREYPHYALNGSRKLFSDADLAALWEAMRLRVRDRHPLFFQPATASPPVTFTPPGVDPFADLLPRRKREK